jgi:hypothetical protein
MQRFEHGRAFRAKVECIDMWLEYMDAKEFTFLRLIELLMLDGLEV